MTDEDYTDFRESGTRDTNPNAQENVRKLDQAIAAFFKKPALRAYDARRLGDSASIQGLASAFGATVQGFRVRPTVPVALRKTYGFFNGAYSKGIVFLNENADRPHPAVLGHELGHRLRRTASSCTRFATSSMKREPGTGQ